MSGDSGAQAGGGIGEECEGEEQEDPSSSSFELPEESFNQLSISGPEGGNKENLNDSVEDALSTFRQQWQKELGSPSKQKITADPDVGEAAAESLAVPDASSTESVEEIAKKLFLSGVDHEQNGKLFEAIRFYKRAVALIPDIELRLYESTQKKAVRDETLQIETGNNTVAIPQDDDEFENESLLERIQRIVARTGCFCQPEYEQKTAHISCLPTELVLYILRWVVSSELDMLSLERCAAVCRGFYLSARDQEIWRLACLKIWGVKCGTPSVVGFGSWRQMYVERVRLRFNGCYISKTTYLRLGENSFQDQFYKPWHIIDYYRYLRFFSDGVVLMLTTAEEPSSSISLLKQRHNRPSGVLSGEYRLHGDKVVIIVRKVLLGANKQPPSNTRFRPRRNPAQSPPETNVEQISNLELQIQSYRNRPSLVWCGYTVFTRNSNGGESSSSFDIVKSRFPPFRFSKVKSYQAESESPLQ